jgi:hypothetical protein
MDLDLFGESVHGLDLFKSGYGYSREALQVQEAGRTVRV